MGSALAYPLGDALIRYVYESGGFIRQKIAICEYVQTLATAQLRSRPPTLSTLKKRSILDQIGRDIDELWGYYEPILDTSSYQYGKRAVFQIVLRQILTILLTIIDKSKLLDSRYMATGGFHSTVAAAGRRSSS